MFKRRSEAFTFVIVFGISTISYVFLFLFRSLTEIVGFGIQGLVSYFSKFITIVCKLFTIQITYSSVVVKVTSLFVFEIDFVPESL